MNDNNLKSAERHVKYEYEQFDACASKLAELSENASERLSDFMRNAILESCLLHARNLIEFFYHQPDKKKKYWRASELGIAVNKPVEIDPIYDRLNGYLSHLAVNRSCEPHDWREDITKLQNEFGKISEIDFGVRDGCDTKTDDQVETINVYTTSEPRCVEFIRIRQNA